MSKTLIGIDIEQFWHFLPITKDYSHGVPMSMWIDTELYEEWKTAALKFSQVNGKIEQLYRAQEGLKPHSPRDIPSHELVEKTDGN